MGGDVYVRFSFDDSVKSLKGNYKYQMRFTTKRNNTDDWTTQRSETNYFDSKGQQEITISLSHLKRMRKLIVGTTSKTEQKKKMQWLRTTLRKATAGFFYGHNFNINVNKRRRLAETPKPLGWKPSHDMDWSSEYRQRRR